MSTSPARTPRPHTRWRFALVFGLLGAVVVGVITLAFTWPSATASAKDLPIAISGPASQVRELEAGFAREDPDPIGFRSVDSRAEAVALIRDRTVYGGIVLGDAPEVLTSSAASTASNQLLRSVAGTLQTRITTNVLQGLDGALKAGAPVSAAPAIPTVAVTDVVALSDDDPTGGGLAAASFPLVLGGMLGGVLISLLVVGAARRLVALVVYGVAAGGIVALVLQTWLHILQRDWVPNAAGLGLGMTATAALVVGVNALLGTRGIAVGAVISVLVGNPISGATVPYQFLAAPWGEVGQFFVSGAASSLVRTLSYFPDADPTKQWLVLAAWAVGGMLLTVIGHFRGAAPIPLPAGEFDAPAPAPDPAHSVSAPAPAPAPAPAQHDHEHGRHAAV